MEKKSSESHHNVWEEEGERRRPKEDKIAVTVLPMPLAVVCCVLNFILPGMGTLTAGCLWLCCGRGEGRRTGRRVAGCCVNVLIALLQLLLTAFFLLGWIWSCIWGVAFLVWSAELYHTNKTGDSSASSNNSVAPAEQAMSDRQCDKTSRDPPPPYGDASSSVTSSPPPYEA